MDGKQIVERRIAIDVDEEDWTEVKRFSPVVEQVVQIDPAITLADIFVLTGWGAVEINEELQRRKREADERQRAEGKRRESEQKERIARRWQITRRSCVAAFAFGVLGGAVWPCYRLVLYVMSFFG